MALICNLDLHLVFIEIVFTHILEIFSLSIWCYLIFTRCPNISMTTVARKTVLRKSQSD